MNIKYYNKFGKVLIDDILTEIVEYHWNFYSQYHKNDPNSNVKFTDVYQHDACNHTLSGNILYKDVLYKFIIDNGNWDGTRIIEFDVYEESDFNDYVHPEPTKYMFFPKDPLLEYTNPTMYSVYLYWKTQKWFIDKLNKFKYDIHFQPGCYIRNEYEKWANTKGLTIGVE